MEKSILKSITQYPHDMQAFLQHIPEEAFSKEAKIILATMRELESQNVLNLSTLESALSENIKHSEFYIEFLNAPSNINYLTLKPLFLNEFKLKQQRLIANKLLNASNNNELLDLDLLIPAVNTHNEFKSLESWQGYYDSRPSLPRFKTLIPFLDNPFEGGIEVGQLVLISGDPEAGKTMLGTQIIENIAREHKVAFFCFEFTIKSYLKAKANTKLNKQNMIVINDGYNINDIAQNIKDLYKSQGIRVFLIDSQMRITSPAGRNMEEEESLKFSTLAKLCHSLDLLVFLIVQTSKGDRDNPMGSKKGGHEASIIMRIEHSKAKDENLREFSENERIFIIKKNKQTGKHFKEKVRFDTQSLRFNPMQREVEANAKEINKAELEQIIGRF